MAGLDFARFWPVKRAENVVEPVFVLPFTDRVTQFIKGQRLSSKEHLVYGIRTTELALCLCSLLQGPMCRHLHLSPPFLSLSSKGACLAVEAHTEGRALKAQEVRHKPPLLLLLQEPPPPPNGTLHSFHSEAPAFTLHSWQLTSLKAAAGPCFGTQHAALQSKSSPSAKDLNHASSWSLCTQSQK